MAVCVYAAQTELQHVRNQRQENEDVASNRLPNEIEVIAMAEYEFNQRESLAAPHTPKMQNAKCIIERFSKGINRVAECSVQWL